MICENSFCLKVFIFIILFRSVTNFTRWWFEEKKKLEKNIFENVTTAGEVAMATYLGTPIFTQLSKVRNEKCSKLFSWSLLKCLLFVLSGLFSPISHHAVLSIVCISSHLIGFLSWSSFHRVNEVLWWLCVWWRKNGFIVKSEWRWLELARAP